MSSIDAHDRVSGDLPTSRRQKQAEAGPRNERHDGGGHSPHSLRQPPASAFPGLHCRPFGMWIRILAAGSAPNDRTALTASMCPIGAAIRYWHSKAFLSHQRNLALAAASPTQVARKAWNGLARQTLCLSFRAEFCVFPFSLHHFFSLASSPSTPGHIHRPLVLHFLPSPARSYILSFHIYYTYYSTI